MDKASKIPQSLSEKDNLALIHKLQVHQIEMEMQNEELRRTRVLLEESFEKFSDLYDFAPVGYVSLTQEGIIIESNLTFANQVGIDKARLADSSFLMYLTAEEQFIFRSHLSQVFKTRERQRCELQLKNMIGPERYVHLHSVWVLKNDGAEICRMSVMDISERKKIEEKLIKVQDELGKRVIERTSELSENEKNFRNLSQEFQTLLNAISDTLILLSPTMEVLWTNNENTFHLDESASEAVEQYCYKLLHDRPVTFADCPVTRCFITAEKEVSILTHHGAVIDIRAFPIKEAEKVTSVLLLVSDITEKMARQAEAIHASHMASLGELAAGVAHEINNPITGIINYGQILLNECRDESMEKDIGERIVKEGERIDRIVKTLLSYAHDRRETKRPTHIQAILDESLILIQAQIRKEGIDLKINFPDNLPEIDANFHQIQQCFINVVNNARYALNEKFPDRSDDKHLVITSEKVEINDSPYVRVIFTDTGVGIPSHELPMLTKPFFSTKPFGKGTGLGLDITQKIITDHNGFISFESTPGEFTRVIIDLPAVQTRNEAEYEC